MRDFVDQSGSSVIPGGSSDPERGPLGSDVEGERARDINTSRGHRMGNMKF
jgi:hypothetical protein